MDFVLFASDPSNEGDLPMMQCAQSMSLLVSSPHLSYVLLSVLLCPCCLLSGKDTGMFGGFVVNLAPAKCPSFDLFLTLTSSP